MNCWRTYLIVKCKTKNDSALLSADEASHDYTLRKHRCRKSQGRVVGQEF